MKTESKIHRKSIHYSFAGVVSAGAFLLISASAPAQNLFEAELAAGLVNIYEYSPSAVRSTFVSWTPGTIIPQGLAFNSAGDLFVSDTGSGNIYEFAPGGGQNIFASGLDPAGLAFNSAGDLFEADPGSGNIYEFTPGGVRSTFASGLSDPEGLAFDTSGINLYESDESSGTIDEFLPNATQITLANGLNNPIGLACNNNDVYVANYSGNNIYQIPLAGGTPVIFSSGLSGPSGLAFDNTGNLFEIDDRSGHINEFTPLGTESTFASGLNGSYALAFQPVPEPSALGLLAAGVAALFVRCRRNWLRVNRLIVVPSTKKIQAPCRRPRQGVYTRN